MQALTYLQRALLVHDLQALDALEWESCFNKVTSQLSCVLGQGPLPLGTVAGCGWLPIGFSSAVCGSQGASCPGAEGPGFPCLVATVAAAHSQQRIWLFPHPCVLKTHLPRLSLFGV